MSKFKEERDKAAENAMQYCWCNGKACYGCEEYVEKLITIGYNACLESSLVRELYKCLKSCHGCWEHSNPDEPHPIGVALTSYEQALAEIRGEK